MTKEQEINQKSKRKRQLPGVVESIAKKANTSRATVHLVASGAPLTSTKRKVVRKLIDAYLKLIS